jgi:hypothetical protein
VTWVGLQIRNLHFNRAALHIRACLKCQHGIFDRKPMRHQFPNVAQQPGLHQPYRLGPRISIPVLEPEIHLPRRQPHERKLHLVLSDADNEYGAAKPDGVDRGADRRLSARALQCDVWLRAAHRLHDPRCQGLRRFVRCNVKRAHAAGRKRFSECEAPGVEVGDDEWVGSRRAGAEHCRQPDWPSTTYERRVAEPQIRALDGRQGDRERFKERAVLVGEGLWELVAPYRRMGDVTAQQSRNGRRGAEEDALAAIVPASEARRAGVARDPGLDCDTISWLEMGYGWMHSDDLKQNSR